MAVSANDLQLPQIQLGKRKVELLALDFLVQGMPTKVLVELLLLNRFGLRFLIARCNVTGGRFPLLARFRAF